MTKKRFLIAMLIPAAVMLALLAARYSADNRPPASWRQLQQWAASAAPGELLSGNAELGSKGGMTWAPLHTQQQEMPFLYSDNPEYLYNDSVGKALSSMRLTNGQDYAQHAEKAMPFGVGMHHINLTTDPTTKKTRPLAVKIVISLLPSVQEGRRRLVNHQTADVRLQKGAYGLSNNMPIYAGKACALHWFRHPNVPPASLTLQPGETRTIFTKLLNAETGMNAMFDFTATNAYFLKVYVVCGEVEDYSTLSYAPYGLTIGTNSGAGPYWKRTLLAPPGAPAFDAADLHRRNKLHVRYYFHAGSAEENQNMQYLVDESWEQRPDTPGKAQIRGKGGKRRPFKGDYNVEYLISLPVRASTGRPARFALIDTQRFGIFAGAIRTADGHTVSIPNDPERLLHWNNAGEGVLLDRATVSSREPINYTFRWLLPGGTYGDQDFMLIPLPGEK